MAERSVNINANVLGVDQVERLKRQLEATNQSGLAAAGALGQIGSALTNKTVPEMSAYVELWRKGADGAKAFAAMAVNSLNSVSATMNRQRDLAKFYGTSLFTTSMISMNKSAKEFVAGGGRGFSNWLQSASSQLAEYRLALAAAGAAFAAFGAMAAMTAKQSAYAIDSFMDSMEHRFSDAGAMRDWFSQGDTTTRGERLDIMDTLLSQPNFFISGEQAAPIAESIEKYWFANQERMKKHGIASAEALADQLASGNFSPEESLSLFGDYGLAMSKAGAPGRFAMMGELSSGIDMDEEKEKRPEVMLQKNLQSLTDTTGDLVVPVMNKLLGTILKIGEAVGKIPGADKIVGWGLVFGTAVAGGTLFLSVLGGMIPLIKNSTRLLHLDRLAHIARTLAIKAYSIAAGIASTATKLLGISIKTALIGTGVGAILVLAGVMAGFAYKTGALQKAWDKFRNSAIGKDFAEGIAWAAEKAEALFGWVGKAFDKLDKAYASGDGPKLMFTAALGPIAAPIILMSKVMSAVDEKVKKLIDGSDTLQKLAKTANTVSQRIMEFIEKLVSIFSAAKDLVQSILDALPGADRRKAEKELEEKAAKYGFKYKNGEFIGTVAGGEQKISDSDLKKNHREIWDALQIEDEDKRRAAIQNALTQPKNKDVIQRGTEFFDRTTSSYGPLTEAQVNAIDPTMWQEHLDKEAMPDFWGELIGPIEDLIPGAKRRKEEEKLKAIYHPLGISKYVSSGEEGEQGEFKVHDTEEAKRLYGVNPQGTYSAAELRARFEKYNTLTDEDEIASVRDRLDQLGPQSLNVEAEQGFFDDLKTTLETAIKNGFDKISSLDVDIPGLGTLTDALDRLSTAIDNWLPGLTGDEAEKALEDAGLTRADLEAGQGHAETEDTDFFLANGEIIAEPKIGVGARLKSLVGMGADANGPAAGAPPMDVGGPIMSTGGLIGHEGEEMTPANVVRGGQTTLSKINEMMGGAVPQGGGDTYNINAPISLHADSINSDLDFDRLLKDAQQRLMFDLRNDLQHNQWRSSSYLRGGSIF